MRARFDGAKEQIAERIRRQSDILFNGGGAAAMDALRTEMRRYGPSIGLKNFRVNTQRFGDVVPDGAPRRPAAMDSLLADVPAYVALWRGG